MLTPITVINNGSGKTACVSAGNHGDEYPTQIAVMKLCREVQPEQVQGRLVLLPGLNMAAVKSATRLSPLDGRNLNRSFPGKADGTVSEMIAHYMTTVLFPMADIVVDLHTGGRSVDFTPCAHMHLVPNLDQRRQMLAGTEAWNSEYCFLYTDIAGTGLLPVEAESQGKIVITTEMGGGEPVPAAVHRLTQSGLSNVLRHFGILEGKVVSRAEAGVPEPKWVQALSRDDYLFAPESGIYEGLVDLTKPVSAGQPVGRVHFPERPDREPVDVTAKSDGMLLATRGPCLVAQGDCVACIAHPADPRSAP